MKVKAESSVNTVGLRGRASGGAHILALREHRVGLEDGDESVVGLPLRLAKFNADDGPGERRQLVGLLHALRRVAHDGTVEDPSETLGSSSMLEDGVGDDLAPVLRLGKRRVLEETGEELADSVVVYLAAADRRVVSEEGTFVLGGC